jgi:hypothetical protein
MASGEDKDLKTSLLLQKLRENPLFRNLEKLRDDKKEDENDGSRSLKDDQLRNEQQNQGNANSSAKPKVEKKELELANKKLGDLKSKEVVEDILDFQIAGHQMAIKEIEDKINAINEEELAQKALNTDNVSKLRNRISSQSLSQKTANPLQEELKMLTDLLKESRDKVGKLQIKKNEEEFKRQIVEIMRDSEELDSYNEYDAKRKGKNRVFLLPSSQVGSLSEIFGQADIAHEIIEVPANQVQQQGNSQQFDYVANQDQQNQPSQEQVTVIVVNDPQIFYQQQYQQGKEQISQGGSWVEMVKNIRSNQSQLSSPSSQSFSKPQANSSMPVSSQTQSQLPSKPVVGGFTKMVAEQRSGALVVSQARASLPR